MLNFLTVSIHYHILETNQPATLQAACQLAEAARLPSVIVFYPVIKLIFFQDFVYIFTPAAGFPLVGRKQSRYLIKRFIEFNKLLFSSFV